jgi:hypothetical protein
MVATLNNTSDTLGATYEVGNINIFGTIPIVEVLIGVIVIGAVYLLYRVCDTYFKKKNDEYGQKKI